MDAGTRNAAGAASVARPEETPLRRHRQALTPGRCREVLAGCDAGVLSFMDVDDSLAAPLSVPVNHVWVDAADSSFAARGADAPERKGGDKSGVASGEDAAFACDPNSAGCLADAVEIARKRDAAPEVIGTLYFHGAGQGRKSRGVDERGPLGLRGTFCVVGRDVVVPEKLTTSYVSVVCTGRLVAVTDPDEKRWSLEELGRHLCPGFEEKASRAIDHDIARMQVFALRVETMSGKQSSDLLVSAHKRAAVEAAKAAKAAKEAKAAEAAGSAAAAGEPAGQATAFALSGNEKRNGGDGEADA